MRHLLVSLIIIIAGTGLVPRTAHAQTGVDAGAKVEKSAQAQSFEAIERLRTELDALEKDRRVATGEERDLIVDQVVAKRQELSKEIAGLVGELTREKAEHSPAVLDRARTMLRRERKRIDTEYEATEKALAELKKEASEVESPAARIELDSELAGLTDRLVTLLKQQFENLELREKLGANVESDRKRLDERLVTRARRLAVTIEAASDERGLVSARPATSDDEKKAKKSDLAAVNQRIDELALSMRELIELLKQRGLASTDYQQLLIEATGQVTTDVFDRDVSFGLVESALQRAEEWVAERAPHAAFALFLFALIVVVSWLVSRLVRKLVRRSVDKTEMSVLARDFAARSSGRAVIAIGLLTGLSQLGIELGPVLAGLGIAGFVIGFALQDTLSNFASGLMILVYRPFDVGDLVEVSGVSGKVDQMTLVSTSILTLDNQLLIIPNNKIWNNVIRNVMAQDRRRVDFLFGIGYDDDIDKARDLLRDIAKNTENVEADGEIIVEVHEFGDSSVNFVVRVWTQTENYWPVFWSINAEVKRRFDAEGVSIPFPQRDVHIHNAA